MAIRTTSSNFVKLLLPLLIAVIASVLAMQAYFDSSDDHLVLQAKDRILTGDTQKTAKTLVKTGWSVAERPQAAIAEALEIAASDGAGTAPDFVMVYTTRYTFEETQSLLQLLRQRFGARTKIYAGDSFDDRVLTDKGLVAATGNKTSAATMEGSKALVIMVIHSSEISFGVASVAYNGFPTRQLAASDAVRRAVADAGRGQGQMPQAVLLSPRGEREIEDIEGIESVVGKDTPILGGLRSYSMTATGSVVTCVEDGMSLAVIYTDLPVGHAFQGGYRVKDLRTGLITKRDNDVIYEIDNRPAYEVYDEWLSGEVTKLIDEGNDRKLEQLMLLNPLCQQFTTAEKQSYFLFGVGWPNKVDLSFKANFKIQTNDRIYLSQGNWEYLLNSMGHLPKLAKINAGMGYEEKVVLAIGHLCSGVMSLVPDEEKDKIPVLLNHSTGGAPLIASMTAGEQGYFPGVGNKAGHLLYSFLVIGERK